MASASEVWIPALLCTASGTQVRALHQNKTPRPAAMPGAVEIIGAWLAMTIGKTRIEAFSDGVIATIITT